MARPSWESETWVTPSTKEELAAEFESWGTVPRKIIDMVQNTDIWALFDYADNPSKTYYKGRVCVSGDAAHASTPFQGAGAAMAIEDAYVLSNLLGAIHRPEDVETSLRAYDAVRRERTQKMVETSREAGQVWGLDLEGHGDDYAKIMHNATRRMFWIWDEDLEKEVQQGQEIMAAA
jgi:salicylate hydroxylase